MAARHKKSARTGKKAHQAATQDELRRQVGSWRPYHRPESHARPASNLLAAFWIAGGALTAALVAGGGISGRRLDEGMAAAILAALVGVLVALMGRDAPGRFPWMALHLTVLATAFALFVGADHAHPATVVVAILALAVLVAVAVGALMPRAWTVVDLTALCAGLITISTVRHLEAPLVAPLLGAVTVGCGALAACLSAALRRRALTDPVTGLPNRSALELIVGHQIALCRRTGAPMTLVLISLDDDPVTGSRRDPADVDWAMTQVAADWSSMLRGTDVLARYGASDMVVVLPDCDQPGVEAVVRRMLAATGDRGTAGATGYVPGDSFDSMMQRARRSAEQARDLGHGEVLVRSAEGTQLSTAEFFSASV